MASVNLNRWVFFNEASTSAESTVLVNGNRGEELTVQVSGIGNGSAAIKILGKTDDENQEEYVELAGIGMSDYKIYPTITKDGIYKYSISGVIKIKGLCTSGLGNFKAYGIVTG